MTKAEKMAYAAQRYQAGATTYEIGREIGHSHAYVWNLLMDAGVRTRRQGPRPGRKYSQPKVVAGKDNGD